MDEIEKRVKEMLEFGEKDAGIGVTQKGTILRFSRANMDDWEEIKGIDDEELINQFKGLEYLINEAGFSIRDLQLLDLCSLEIKRRGLEDKVVKRK